MEAWDDSHVVVLAQSAEIAIELFDSLLVRLDALALQPLVQLEKSVLYAEPNRCKRETKFSCG